MFDILLSLTKGSVSVDMIRASRRALLLKSFGQNPEKFGQGSRVGGNDSQDRMFPFELRREAVRRCPDTADFVAKGVWRPPPNRDSVAMSQNLRGRAMMGRLNRDQGQLFYCFNLEEVVPADHQVRQISEVLNLSWVRIIRAQVVGIPARRA
jgi:hypothetical protein